MWMQLQDVRSLLHMTPTHPPAASLFAALFPAFSVSVGAALSLCFLSQCYTTAWGMLQALAEPPLNSRIAATIVELSQLCSMLEAPAFASLRLQLATPGAHPMLLQCLYGVLMLLPQGEAFRSLHTRLSCLPSSGGGGLRNGAVRDEGLEDDSALLEAFVQGQLRVGSGGQGRAGSLSRAGSAFA
jgi:hypothetical protein